MSNEETYEEAAAEVREIIGDDVIALLANASRTHNVMISLHISPNDEVPRVADD